MGSAHGGTGARALIVFAVTMFSTACTGMLQTFEGEECAEDADCPTGFVCLSGGCHQDLSGGDACVDEDEDGFFVGRCPGAEMPDCDDADPDRNPGSPEICGDDIDQNCVGGADELCDCLMFGVGATRDCPYEGACAGVQTCGETGWGECVPNVSPEFEECGESGSGDGVDQDCDGEVDEDCCGPRPDGMGDEVACPDDLGEPSFCSSNGICQPDA